MDLLFAGFTGWVHSFPFFACSSTISGRRTCTALHGLQLWHMLTISPIKNPRGRDTAAIKLIRQARRVRLRCLSFHGDREPNLGIRSTVRGRDYPLGGQKEFSAGAEEYKDSPSPSVHPYPSIPTSPHFSKPFCYKISD